MESVIMNLIKEYLGHLFNREVGNFLEPDHSHTEYFKRDDHNTKPRCCMNNSSFKP